MKFTIEQVYESMKLNDVLKEQLGVSSRLIRQLKKDKGIMVNDHPLSLSAKLRIGDVVSFELLDEENIFEPEEMEIPVCYEDDHFIVINKLPYKVVHPTKGHPFGTIANGIAHYMISKGDHYKIRFANRLDRDTSGVMVICKDGFAQKIVSDQMQDQTIEKYYDAIVHGNVEKDVDVINLPIGRAFEDSVNRIVREDGAKCITEYEVVERFEGYTWLKVRIRTGRTHQIRVHLSHIGHPIVGDELYGGALELIKRQALHACRIGFKDILGQPIDVSADWYEDMTLLLEKLRS